VDVESILAELYSDQGKRNPFPLYAALHELGPISALPRRAEKMVTVAVANGYDVVDEVLRAPGYYKQEPPGWQEHEVLRTFQTSMMFVNPPDHGRMRSVFHRTFTPRRLGALEPVVTRVVDNLLDRMAEKSADGSEIDFVEDFAYPIPALVMAEFIGIPEQHLEFYREQVDRIDDFLDISGKTPEKLAAANDAAGRLREFYRDLIAHRRRTPSEDLISGLVEAVDSGGVELSEEELISNLIVLFNASFVTTVYMFSNGLPLLLDRPDLVAALPGDTTLAADCVEEILRLESPVHFLARAASEDTEVGGVPVGKDENIVLLICAANRDPARFPEPDRFLPGRAGPPQLGFGAGMHFCLGAAVSKLEGRLALPRLFARFPTLTVTGEPVLSGSLFLRGIDVLPVSVAG